MSEATETYYAMMWCGVEGDFTDETAQAHADSCEECRHALAVFVAQQAA